MSKKHRAKAPPPAAAPTQEPEGFFDQLGAMGNSFVQDAVGLGQAVETQGYMHSPWLRELLGGPPAHEPRESQDRQFSSDPSQAWSHESLEARLHYDYEGADGKSLVGDDGLRTVMTRLAEERPTTDDPEVLATWESQQKKAALQLGELRGQSPEAAMKGYADYRRLQAEQRQRAEELGLPAPEALDMTERGDHMGSIQQLRSGSYVGQAMGIDDVYGALLNPTGGLVGEGNEGYSADADSVASYHGEAHDAFGFLANFHDVGPGYMYANPDEAQRFGNRDPGSLRPYTGQASGFTLWNDLMADNGMADPKHPGDVDAQMRESLGELGHGEIIEDLSRPMPIAGPLTANPQPGVPGIASDIPDLVETVESIIHGIGELAGIDTHDILA